MQMPGRTFQASTTSYRFGFNGKENDNEVKGEGNQQDYGMRIYDPRLGRFLSVDPITSKYAELTPYQFASNRPIDGIDQDGLEYIRSIPHFYNSGKRTFFDYVAAFDNGAIDVLNTIPALWNSGVSTVQSVRRGTYGEDVKRDFKQVGSSIKKAAVTTWNAPLKTLTSPEALEVTVSIYLGGKIPLPGGAKGNFLTPATVSEGLAESFSSGGTKLVSSAMLDKFPGKPTFGNPLETYIAPTSEVNAILSEGLSRIELSVKLGITDPAFLKGNLIRIDLTPKALKSLNLRAATGNEVGANSLYIPGGKTAGDVTEGVVNGIPKAAAGVSSAIIPK